jgi:hypothetical protein
MIKDMIDAILLLLIISFILLSIDDKNETYNITAFVLNVLCLIAAITRLRIQISNKNNP